MKVQVIREELTNSQGISKNLVKYKLKKFEIGVLETTEFFPALE